MLNDAEPLTTLHVALLFQVFSGRQWGFLGVNISQNRVSTVYLCLDFAQWINLSPGTGSTVIISFLRFQVVPQS